MEKAYENYKYTKSIEPLGVFVLFRSPTKEKEINKERKI